MIPRPEGFASDPQTRSAGWRVWALALGILLVLFIGWFWYAASRPTYESPPDLSTRKALNSYADAICRGSPPPNTEFQTIAVDCNGA